MLSVECFNVFHLASIMSLHYLTFRKLKIRVSYEYSNTEVNVFPFSDKKVTKECIHNINCVNKSDDKFANIYYIYVLICSRDWVKMIFDRYITYFRPNTLYCWRFLAVVHCLKSSHRIFRTNIVIIINLFAINKQNSLTQSKEWQVTRET